MITFAEVELTFGRESNSPTDVALKEIDFPGVDGIEEMNMGSRTRSISISGRIIDDSDAIFSSSVIDVWKKTRLKSSLVTPTRTYTNCVVDDASCDNYDTTLPANKRGCTYTITFKKLR